MNRYRPLFLQTVTFLVVVGSAVAALAVPPPDTQLTDIGLPGTTCEHGAHQGAACSSHAECSPSKCVYPDFLDRHTLKGTLTIVVDDHVTDWRDDMLMPRKAITVLLETGAGKHKRTFSETLESVAGSAGEPAYVVIQGSGGPESFPIAESNLVDPHTTCETWLPRFRQPPPQIARGLIALAGLTGETVRPVIAAAKSAGPTPSLAHAATGDALASVVRCKVTIEFAPLPLL